jgi:protocatechuate 3,4-dioxygenase beta subunit
MLQCIATPAMTDGPFFVEEKLDRANLIMGETADTLVQAMPLRLVIGVFDVKGMMCTPVAGATVDIWHADSVGIYSDVASGIVQSMDTRGKKFLRGYQVTDERGLVAFDTIYPGWYMSRTIHIHFKLRMLGSGSSAKEFTSQMFFDEAINAKVLAQGPYATHTGRQVMNDDDHIFNGTAMNGQKPASGQEAPGKAIMPTMEMMGNGYVATLKIGLMG